MANDLDPYAVLGVTRGATTAEIRKRYHDLARAAHPDVVGDRGLAMMQRLNGAWDVLRDPGRRAVYDTNAAANGSATGEPRHDAPGTGDRVETSRRPGWTGAAGAPPGSPSGSRLDFGLYSGWTLGEISRRDPGYLMWLADRREGVRYAAEIRGLLESIKPMSAPQPRKRRWRA